VGSGILVAREWGAAAPFIEVGNCSAVAVTPQTNRLSVPDYRNPGGGERNSIERVTGFDFAITFHDINQLNLARFGRGHVTTNSSGAITNETVVGYKGGWVSLANLATVITTVEPVGGGTAYVEGTDYVFARGMLYIPAGSSIADPVSGAPNFQVDYTRAAADRVQMAVTAQKFFEMEFRGANEARAGKLLSAKLHKVSAGFFGELAMVGQDYAGPQVTSRLIYDAAKATDSNTSGYFVWNQQA
jgi:hypothetical protein